MDNVVSLADRRKSIAATTPAVDAAAPTAAYDNKANMFAYMLPGVYEYIVDQGHTPHLSVDARIPNTRVPQAFVRDNHIVLNIAMSAVTNLQLHKEFVSFSARFNGKHEDIFVPMAAIKAIYANENGMGIAQP